MKRAGRLAASLAVCSFAGCGGETDVTLAKVPPVTQAPVTPKAAPKGKNGSPAVLPGAADR